MQTPSYSLSGFRVQRPPTVIVQLERERERENTAYLHRVSEVSCLLRLLFLQSAKVHKRIFWLLALTITFQFTLTKEPKAIL